MANHTHVHGSDVVTRPVVVCRDFCVVSVPVFGILAVGCTCFWPRRFLLYSSYATCGSWSRARSRQSSELSVVGDVRSPSASTLILLSSCLFVVGCFTRGVDVFPDILGPF